jgi:hypothetical protein
MAGVAWLAELALLACAVFVPAQANALVIDFDTLPAGTILNASHLPPGYTLNVNNKNASHPDSAIIFDTACPPGGVGSDCTGSDPDLLTPGGGIANDTAQQKMLIVGEDVVDTTPANGLVDDPDDEARGSTIAFGFPGPRKLISIRLVDIDTTEGATKIVLDLAAGGTQTINVAALGNNSAQTITLVNPPDILGFTMDFAGSGAIDDITIQSICGDDIKDDGEQCDGTDDALCPGECDEECSCPEGGTTTSSTTTSTSTTSTSTTTLPPVCGNGVIETGEVCDDGEANSDTVPNACRTDCTRPVCGDGVHDTETEACDDGEANSDTVPDACRTDCTLPDCGDGVLDDGEACDDGTGNSGTTPDACRLDCTEPICGDGVKDSDEECDNGALNSDTNPGACRTDCTLFFCGDGIVDTPTEACEPATPNAEHCANMKDDDGDGLIDCADTADCPENQPRCSFNCVLATCEEILDDPAYIKFDKGDNGADMFWIHGRFIADGDLDLDNDTVSLMLSNKNGVIYQATLVGGQLDKMINGKGRYVFRDRTARRGEGGDADGIYRITMRIAKHSGVDFVAFRLRAYGDFSAATEPRMTTQIMAGDNVGALTVGWTRTRQGWILRQSDFNDDEN